MEVKNQIELIQEKLPQVKGITTLDEIKVIEPAEILQPKPKEIPIQRKVSVKLLLAGLLFFSILSVELAIIYRYDRLNKRLYQISVSLKDKLVQTRNELRQSNRVKTQVLKNRDSLLAAYRERDLSYNKLQLKEEGYKKILTAKTSWLEIFQGELRVLTAQVEALKVQQEILSGQVKQRDADINQLTVRLINNIGEQELLVNKNLKLQEERDELAKELYQSPEE